MILLVTGLLFMVPWVNTKAREEPPPGMESWKERALEIESATTEAIPGVRLYIRNFVSTYFPVEATGSYWIISASEARFETMENLELTRPMLRIINPEKDDAVTVIRSSAGQCNTNGEFVYLSGNVRTRTYTGDYLETEDLCYDPSEEMSIFSKGPFVLTQASQREPIRGKGIYSDPRLSKMRFGSIQGRVSGGMKTLFQKN